MTKAKTRYKTYDNKWKDYMGLSLFLGINALIIGFSINNIYIIIIGILTISSFFIFKFLNYRFISDKNYLNNSSSYSYIFLDDNDKK